MVSMYDIAAVYRSQNRMNRHGKLKVKQKTENVEYIMMKRTKKTVSTNVSSSSSMQLPGFSSSGGSRRIVGGRGMPFPSATLSERRSFFSRPRRRLFTRSCTVGA